MTGIRKVRYSQLNCHEEEKQDAYPTRGLTSTRVPTRGRVADWQCKLLKVQFFWSIKLR
jgi:hypothetical protein